MANDYCESAGLIPPEQVLDYPKIAHFYELFVKACDRAIDRDSHFPFHEESGCQFNLAIHDDGSLYWANIDYFEVGQFTEFISVCIKRKWLTAPISGAAAWFCDKPRPNAFGGLYFRVTDQDAYIITTSLDRLPTSLISEVELAMMYKHHG